MKIFKGDKKVQKKNVIGETQKDITKKKTITKKKVIGVGIVILGVISLIIAKVTVLKDNYFDTMIKGLNIHKGYSRYIFEINSENLDAIKEVKDNENNVNIAGIDYSDNFTTAWTTAEGVQIGNYLSTDYIKVELKLYTLNLNPLSIKGVVTGKLNKSGKTIDITDIIVTGNDIYVNIGKMKKAFSESGNMVFILKGSKLQDGVSYVKYSKKDLMSYYKNIVNVLQESLSTIDKVSKNIEKESKIRVYDSENEKVYFLVTGKNVNPFFKALDNKILSNELLDNYNSSLEGRGLKGVDKDKINIIRDKIKDTFSSDTIRDIQFINWSRRTNTDGDIFDFSSGLSWYKDTMHYTVTLDGESYSRLSNDILIVEPKTYIDYEEYIDKFGKLDIFNDLGI